MDEIDEAKNDRNSLPKSQLINYYIVKLFRGKSYIYGINNLPCFYDFMFYNFDDQDMRLPIIIYR